MDSGWIISEQPIRVDSVHTVQLDNCGRGAYDVDASPTTLVDVSNTAAGWHDRPSKHSPALQNLGCHSGLHLGVLVLCVLYAMVCPHRRRPLAVSRRRCLAQGIEQELSV